MYDMAKERRFRALAELLADLEYTERREVLQLADHFAEQYIEGSAEPDPVQALNDLVDDSR